MKTAGDLVERIAAIQEKAKQQTDRPPAPITQPVSNVIQLPRWAEPVRAVPNGILRSALFGAVKKGARRYMDKELLAAVDGVEIRYTGQRLDQGDLDVWETVLHAVRLQELGSECRLTAYALLKLMGKTDTGKNRVTLQNRIERLVANALTVKQGRYSYMGNLIAGAIKDEDTQEWVIELNPKLRPLFAADQFMQVDWGVRHALDGQPLAQWLHGYYASHAKPYPVNMETLLKLSGSENNEPRSSRQKLRKALDAVAKAGTAHGQPFSYEIHGDLVHVDKPGSSPQRRHVTNKAIRARRRLP